ncbi:calcium-binding EF-hand domain-containing protein [Heterostelium album PN500]|uniref:Calcium-binding EF-hand domain-containing protein n=1 Tax=Heterostelium pallidum (strain ATCC 26659 / Pp 5 / PN500) TaxID=670386 RepID=D3BQB9_HETP5|nr:calcium-binding EF-hand domain-containing protein [Heterostelium album PN500]EFA76339.1 calcium-binding EF-hand domain-containing protein [Heterostelium album PN500]|eukprot:XP_020428471.1 calcium-binding EF-hand domain-containing protein [Heterostelium album PN500]
MTEKFLNILNSSNNSNCSMSSVESENEGYSFSSSTTTSSGSSSSMTGSNNKLLLDSLMDISDIQPCPELPNSPILKSSSFDTNININLHNNDNIRNKLILKSRKHSLSVYRIVLYFNWLLSTPPSNEADLWLSKENVLLLNAMILGYGSVYLHLSNYINMCSQDLSISPEDIEKHNNKCEQRSNNIVNSLHDFLLIWQDEFNFEQKTSMLDVMLRVIQQYNIDSPQFPAHLDLTVEELLASRGLDEAINNDLCDRPSSTSSSHLDQRFQEQLMKFQREQRQSIDYYRQFIRNKTIENNPPLINFRNNHCFDEMLQFFNGNLMTEAKKAIESVGKLASVMGQLQPEGLVVYGSVRALLKLFESTFTQLLYDDKQRLVRIYDQMSQQDHTLYDYPFAQCTTTVELEQFRQLLKQQLLEQYQHYISLPIQCKSSYSSLQYLGEIIKIIDNLNTLPYYQKMTTTNDQDQINNNNTPPKSLDQFDFYNTLMQLYSVNCSVGGVYNRSTFNSTGSNLRCFTSGNNNNHYNGNGEFNQQRSSRMPFLVGGIGCLLGGALSILYLEGEDKKEIIIPKQPLTSIKKTGDKERIVILGTGWASLAFINNIDLDKYEVIVVSPRNYFLFTPMLTAATVGSVEVRSITEPIRRILKRLSKCGSQFIEAECIDIVYNDNYIIIKDASTDYPGAVTSFPHVEIPYDKLVIAVGSMPNTMGTKGVTENCLFLKEAGDARKIRTKIMDCFERANYPGISEIEQRNALHFLIVGAGPTGVEAAGEIYDYIYDDLAKIFPKEIIAKCQISLIQSAEHLLNTYDKKIIDYTEKEFQRSNINALFSSRVTEVQPRKIVVVSKIDKRSYEIPFGMALWCTGVGPRPLTQKFCDSIPEQSNNRAISTDVYLRAIGVPKKNVYAIGDCSTVTQQKLLDHLKEMFKEADENGDDKLSIDELLHLVKNNIQRYPQLEPFVNRLPQEFAEFDVNKDNFLQFDEFQHLIEKIDSNLTTLPATAQVANQMGIYLAKTMNNMTKDPSQDYLDQKIQPFRYKHLGSFAYIGHHNAVADIPGKFSGGGFGVWWAWRAIYLEKQFSLKNKFLVSLDWSKTILFGRDISRL